MSDKLRTFPSNSVEALAFLYIQNRDLSDYTPEQIYDEYMEAVKKIKSHKPSKKATPISWTY